jgi:cytochrome c
MKQMIMTTAAAAFMLGTLAITPATAKASAWGKCKACHHFSEKKKVGPGLKGVMGRHVGAMKDMKYSKALAHGDWVWDEAHLRKWICNSKKAVKEFTGNDHAKTKMPPQKICDAAKQDEVIAKLKSL